MSAYTDRSGLFVLEPELEDATGHAQTATPPAEKGAGLMSVDEEELLLYGITKTTE